MGSSRARISMGCRTRVRPPSLPLLSPAIRSGFRGLGCVADWACDRAARAVSTAESERLLPLHLVTLGACEELGEGRAGPAGGRYAALGKPGRGLCV